PRVPPRLRLASSHVLLPAPSPPPPSTLSLHAALPTSRDERQPFLDQRFGQPPRVGLGTGDREHRHAQPLPAGPDPLRAPRPEARSEEHTSELQSLTNLVCRLLLEKKNTHTAASSAPQP